MASAPAAQELRAAAAVESGSSPARTGQGLFPIKGIWQNPPDLAVRSTDLKFKSFKKLETLDHLAHLAGARSVSAGIQPWYISTPTSPRRLAWDVVGALLILYDLIHLPMEAFSPPETVFTKAMGWTTLLFWTVNMPMSLQVGHSENGLLVMDPGRIALKYLKTWFALDLLVVIPDWVFSIVALSQGETDGTSGDSGESVKLLRVLRLVRMVRLLRLLKLRKMFETFNDLINSEYTSVVVSILQMIMALLVINHLICCVWYSLADGIKDHDDTWIKSHGFQDSEWGYLYMTSFHWSITQFTPASMDVYPHNLLERSFAVVVVIFALVGFSYIVGSITGSLATLRSMNAEESKLFWDLRRYLQKNKVPPQLSRRIQKYLEHMWQQTQDSKPVKDIRLIQLLSEQLHCELKYELAVHHLKIHPFLMELCTVSSVTVHRLANCALSHKLLAEGDTLFHPEEVATHMYIVVKGRYLYKRVDAFGAPHCEQVDEGEDWIAEPALWTDGWSHCGLLTAVDHADNVAINSRLFGEQIRLNPQAHVFASGYAKNFLEWLSGLPMERLSDISQGEDVNKLCRSFIPDDFRESAARRSNDRRRGSMLMLWGLFTNPSHDPQHRQNSS